PAAVATNSCFSMAADSPFPKRLPEFSRAVDDSEDSDWDGGEDQGGDSGRLKASDARSCAMRLSPAARQELAAGDQRVLDCSTLLVGVGPTACGFLTACVLGDDAEILGLISCGFPEAGLANSLGQTALGDFNCFLYRLKCNPQVLVCHAAAPVPPADCHEFAELLLSVLDVESLDLAVLGTQPLTSFQSAEPASSLVGPLLRCLRSSAMLGQGKAAGDAVQQLEPPNLLTGLPAQLLSVCQMRRVPAAAFVAFVAEADCDGEPHRLLPPDPAAMAAFRPALACQPLRYCRPAWPPNSDRVMRLLCRQPGANGSSTYLYT
ncbi:hypothetical protein BOX15_Mlig024131g2, partial [Macrostomum lignano]